MKDKIKETVSNLGFSLTEIDENLYVFDYNKLRFVLTFNGNDKNYAQFWVPCLVERNELNERTFDELMNRFNSNFKYVKCYETNRCMSLYYERDFIGESNMEDVIERIINCLALGASQIRKTVKMETGNDDNNDE